MQGSGDGVRCDVERIHMEHAISWAPQTALGDGPRLNRVAPVREKCGLRRCHSWGGRRVAKLNCRELWVSGSTHRGKYMDAR